MRIKLMRIWVERITHGFRSRNLVFGLVVAILAANSAGASTDWLTWGFDMQRTSFNPTESTLSTTNAAGLTLHWSRKLNGPILTQPLLLRGVVTRTGTHDLVYVGTLYGELVALDAVYGNVVWQHDLPKVQTNCGDFGAAQGYAGIAGTPSIPSTRDRIYVAAGDGALHALDPATGAELTGWPVKFLPSVEQAGLNVAYGSPTVMGGKIYVATAGTCDDPPYWGEVAEINPALLKVTHRFYPNGGLNGPGGGGIWGPGGVSAEPDGTALYAATGNALAEPEDYGYSESVIRLTPTLGVVSASGPALTGASDLDFGATPLVYQAAGCPPQLVAMNKSGAFFVYDRASIGSGPAQRIQMAQINSNGDFIGLPSFDPVLNQLYVGSPSDSPGGTYTHGLIALKMTQSCQVTLVWEQQEGLNNAPYNNPMITPTIANGVVYYASGDDSHLYVHDAATGALLWNSGSLIKSGIFVAPSVANGQVFVASFDHTIYAFGL